MSSIDNLYAVISFFGLAIFFVVLILAWNSFAALDTEIWSASSVGQEIKTNAQNTVNLFDFILVMAWVGLHLGVIVLGFFLRDHPIFYLFAIIMIAVVVIVSVPLSNAYSALTINQELSVAAGGIPMTNFILGKFPVFETIWGFLSAIIFYGFSRWDSVTG